jgi:hypothetical protein
MLKAKSFLTLVFLAGAACENPDRFGPSAETPTADVPQYAVTAPPGIVFASFAMTPTLMNSVHTGGIRGTSPSVILSLLSQVKAKGGRVALNLAGEARNADGTFSFTKWKALIDKYAGVNFSSYINDGTLIAHFIVDEPHFSSRWGGKIIPQATVEAMARYSKQKWEALTTVVNAPPSWLDDVTIRYDYLDAGWAMYRASADRNTLRWVTQQVTFAKNKGLGLFGGLNVLDGGDGSSGFRGNLPGKWAMSASELRTYGSALLAQSYICAFGMWRYDGTYYGRSDVKTVMAELSTKARNHAKTSCKQ